jgi:hypothetical protein
MALQTLLSAPLFKKTPLQVQGSQSAGKRLLSLTLMMTAYTHCTVCSEWHMTCSNHKLCVTFKYVFSLSSFCHQQAVILLSLICWISCMLKTEQSVSLHVELKTTRDEGINLSPTLYCGQ